MDAKNLEQLKQQASLEAIKELKEEYKNNIKVLEKLEGYEMEAKQNK